MRRALTIATLLLAAGGLLAWTVWSGGSERVDAFVVGREPITQTLLVTGRLSPPRRVSLGAMTQSTVVEVLAEEGELVEAGALLARLADDEQAARLEEAEAQVDEASARLRAVTNVGRKVANERLAQAQMSAEQADKAYERAERLFAAKSITEADFEVARLQRDTARSQRVAAELEAAASARGGTDVASAVAAMARVQAAVEVARTQLERTRIRTPIAARVLASDVEVGEVVRPGDVLFELASDEDLEVRITPDELHLGRLAEGQEARVLTDAFPTRPIQAEIIRIAPQVDAGRGTIEVRLGITDELGDLQLRPDMTATVEVLLGRSEDAVAIPTRSVRGLGTATPWVLVDDAGTASRRNVEVGLESETLVEVTAGLAVGDVVLAANTAVGVGDSIRPRIVED